MEHMKVPKYWKKETHEALKIAKEKKKRMEHMKVPKY
jgi:hypothetical protein